MSSDYCRTHTGQHCQQKYVVGEGDKSIGAQFIEDTIFLQMQIQLLAHRLQEEIDCRLL